MADDFSFLISMFDSRDVHKPLDQGVDASATDFRFSRHPTNLEEARVQPCADHEQCIFSCWMDINLKNDTIPQPEHELIFKCHELDIESFRVLGNYEKGKERLMEGIFSGQSNKSTVADKKLTTEEIMRVAGERFIHFSNKQIDGITSFIHPGGSALSSLSPEEIRMVDLAHLLLDSAEKVGNKQFDAADKLLRCCEGKVSESGHPVERIAYHFCKALREKITAETGSSVGMIETDQGRDYSGLSSGVNFTALVLHQKVPFGQVMEFASIQTILENVAAEKKIHLIDLQLRIGVHWTPLIQALSERETIPVQLLKITALQTTDEEEAEKIGKRLQSYANSLNIPFVFKVVSILNMKDLKVESFSIIPGEAVVVYSPIVLRTMIPKPENLQILLRVLRRLRPKIMVVSEVEANHNSTSFVNRFTEALFFFSAWFDVLEDCIERDNPYRMDVERSYFGRGIQNIVSTEGEDRITRSVNMNVWRVFFQSFNMVEIDISEASLDQANLVLQQKFSCGNSCTLYKNGKCLIVGWKGTPLHSVSAWKFM